ncbi:DUF1853 family protein [Rubritalea sp.]|uniref:DUF1853 family protein n=1 Tax=Rubritalea sp. TaxID=2109375 RepID=UPI003EF36F0B
MPFHTSQQILIEYEELYTRAIHESLLSPSVMVGDLPISTSFTPSKLQLPRRDNPQLNFNQKLGHLYEDALAQILSSSTAYKLLAKNTQLITAQKQTIGELDFLLLDTERNEHIHLELAVKFYLIHEQNREPQYPGPDARDNYQRKLTRLINHQLTLTQREDTQELITPLTNSSTIKVQHLIHGIFFDHIHAKTTPLPEYASSNVRRRKWMYFSEMSKNSPSLHTVRVIPKPLWLCEITSEIFQTLVEVPLKELSELAQERCTLCINSSDTHPYFVVPDSWPNH